ncbi:MAG TPA: radical SAM protein [Blastocatellia bacterium]|nr:radical SAM protein [Blastocatellia bacterium]
MNALYPTHGADRDRWILERRGPKNKLEPTHPYAWLWEEEPDAKGAPAATSTIFLTNRECPYRCLMCDLWKNTLDESVQRGAIPTQIRYALERLPAARVVKLYNSGNFFDPQAIPVEDYSEIARTIAGFESVIVECHPALIGRRCLEFRDLIPGSLEVAIGLETVDARALELLNKRMSVGSFRRAAEFLAQNKIALRVFLLLKPPFVSYREAGEWVRRSIDEAFNCGATVCSIIPTRSGNGAMDQLAASSEYSSPTLASLEAAQEFGLGLKRGRVFADLWDIGRFYSCECSPARASRLAEMNRTQQIPPAIACDVCGV